MKNIITMTMIKNEADIVETFVRYTLNYASKMYIIDNGSSDGTLEIIKALIEEGLPIVIKDEAKSFYEQFFIENKYMQQINRNEEFDFFIPVDTDEFLGSDGALIEQIEHLDEEYVYIIPWRTYCLTETNFDNDLFNDIRHYRIDKGKVFTKVIIPHCLMREYKMFMQMGHHDVEGIPTARKKAIDSIFMAHFPVRSKNQIRLKIYQGILSQMMSDYHSVVAYQWRKVHKDLRDDKLNLTDYAATYAVIEDMKSSDISLKEKKLDASWCKEPLIRKYDRLINNDVARNIAYFAERIAIHVITSRADETEKGILIYGTGGTALHLVEYAGTRFMSKVICFIDSNLEKEYESFFDRIIVAPDKIRFFEYAYIVIASNYYDEILDILADWNVDSRKIISAQEFLERQIV